MILFRYKNNTEEYKRLEFFYIQMNNLLDNDKYISKKDYLNIYNSNKEIYKKLTLMNDENVLVSWCKQNKTNYKKLFSFL